MSMRVAVQRCMPAVMALTLAGSPAWAQEKRASAPLPLQPAERLAFDAKESTWMALDVSPDGKTILFDLLGDIYAMDAGGGVARPLLTGVPFETQPVFSPDGKYIAFLSDRSGAANLWVANADGSGARRLSDDASPAVYSSPSWSPDGRFVYISRMVNSLLAFELHAFDRLGGSGIKITKARPSGNEKSDGWINTLGAVASPDGRYLYYSRKTGPFWGAERPLPHWEIVRRDLEGGTEDRIIASPGAAMRPALSHDGTKLVYASRHGGETGLRVRDLVTGSDRWLTLPIDPDSQLGGYANDLVPRVTFLPGDKAVLTAIDGKITRIDLADGKRTPIPFQAPVNLPLAPNTRIEVPDETGPVRVRIIQAPRLSPDGGRVAFAALGRIYVQPLQAGSRPAAVKGVTGMAFQPSWSPDGRTIVYITWTSRDGGHVWAVPAGGGTPRRLTRETAFYTEPVIAPDGRTVAVLRASQTERLNAASDLNPNRPTDIVTMPLGGGEVTLVTQESGARALSWDGKGARLRFQNADGIASVAIDGRVTREEVELKVPTANTYSENGLVAPQDVRLSPRGDRMLLKAASQLYLIDVPPRFGPKPERIELTRPSVAVKRLTEVGADYAGWSADGRTIIWSVGSTIRTIAADRAEALPKGAAEREAARIDAVVELPRDVPKGTVVLRGGTAITMRGDEVIANADVVVTDNRIVAVGPTGSVPVPEGAAIRDVSGKYLLPGFVDTHAHWYQLRREVLDLNHWNMLANLAYGLTSGLDVQPFTVDVFGYQDMIDAGMMIGPRAFSTGPGIFVNSEINSPEQARAVLARYRDHYRTRNIKAYLIGNRTQRQYMTQAAAELGMMPTTEGASHLNLDLTHALDGFAGNEHNLPVSPLREDVVTLYAKSRIAYTPTFVVMYGGRSPFPNMMIAQDASFDPKLRRFAPSAFIEYRFRDLEWTPPFERTAASFARDALRIREAGGLVGIGSHGLVQGLAYHWELQAYAAGGASAHQVLRAATIDSAEVIGRAAQIGSLEAGKYADILVLGANPLANIRNSLSLELVMKNGRIYNAGTLSEVWPRPRPLPVQWFQEDVVSEETKNR